MDFAVSLNRVSLGLNGTTVKLNNISFAMTFLLGHEKSVLHQMTTLDQVVKNLPAFHATR
jgi:hypothetical protein